MDFRDRAKPPIMYIHTYFKDRSGASRKIDGIFFNTDQAKPLIWQLQAFSVPLPGIADI